MTIISRSSVLHSSQSSAQFIVPNWPAPSAVKAYSTTRLSGASGGVYASMNLGLHVGDQDSQVIRNRSKLSSDLTLPSEPVWLTQAHSARVVNADLAIESAVDGTFSTRANTICVVMTADCLPLLLTNQAGDQVAAIHAGWRGMSNGIIENAVALFNCHAAEIVAWAGPCIGPTQFEVGAEVRALLGGPDSAYRKIEDNVDQSNKLLADLYQLCGHRLAAVGVTNYSHSNACTYLDEHHFFSYRRDGQCGRMASLIWIDNES
ncbi:MAG: peptidoglycan editing factor PgeF [Arenicella sp.]|nr:peptidoglycan editing factor PgeF [Arenicella sp.]